MSIPQRLVLSVVALAGAVVLATGCTGTPGSAAPTSTATPSGDSDSGSGGDADDMEAAWLLNGQWFAVVTQGPSGCAPRVDQITSDGQKVAVTLMDDASASCPDDLVPRASTGVLPDGVDPTQNVELAVTYGDVVDTVELDGDASFSAASGENAEFAPSAGWFDDGQLVLVTWGSSSCAPVVESAEGAGAAGTVTFQEPEPDRICTMDLAPRATVVGFNGDVDEDGFQLTLVGDGLDATVPVIG